MDEIVRLWFTGSSEVHKALGKRGGVKSFKLKAKKSMIIFRIPIELVSQFSSLKELVITVRGHMLLDEWLKIDGEVMKRLPGSLEALVLDFDEKFEEMNFPPRLTRLHLPRNRSLSRRSLSNLPRSLIDLDLSSHGATEWIMDSFEISKIEKLRVGRFSLDTHTLPSSLVSLTVRDDDRWFTYDCSMLRSQTRLELLKLQATPKNEDFWHSMSLCFLHTLVSLDIRSWGDYNNEFFGCLPRSMTTIRLGWNFSPSPTLSDGFALLLPQGLVSLVLMPNNYKRLQNLSYTSDHYLDSSLTISVTNLLPPSITKLRIWLMKPTTLRTESFYRTLPTALNDINMSIIDWPYPCVQWINNKFSAFVIRLAAPLTSRYGVSSGDLIPSVSRLWVGNRPAPSANWFVATQLPPRLDRVFWPHSITSFCGKVSSSMIKYLPATITHLELDMSLTNAMIADLSDGLKTLKIGSCHLLNDDCIPSLPHELTHLELTSCNTITLSRFRLPESIRHLVLDGSPRLNFKALPRLLTVFDCHNQHVNDGTIQYLPITLTELSLGRTALLTSKCFSLLPRRLLRLELSSVSFDDDDLKELPRYLRSLVIPNGFQNIGSSGIAQLPPHLTLLSLSGLCFVDHMIGCLPTSLTHLCLPQAEFLTVDCLDLIPPNVSHLGLPASKPYSNCPLREIDIRNRKPHITLLDLGEFYW